MVKPNRKRAIAVTAQAPIARRRGLARSDLVAAALKLLRDEGLDALSTRRLAARLDVKSPALYWHLRNKNELLGLIADALCAKITLPAPSLPFRQRLDAIAWEYRRVLTGHRDAARLFAEQAPTGPHRMKLYDAAIGAFLDSGFAARDALAMATFYRNFLLGLLVEEARQAAALPPTAALAVELSALGDPAHAYPNLHRVARNLVEFDAEALFRMGLHVLLDGMQCQAAAIAPRETSK